MSVLGQCRCREEAIEAPHNLLDLKESVEEKVDVGLEGSGDGM